MISDQAALALKPLAILGASGHGKVIADIAEQLGYTVNFYDDAYPNKTVIEHWPICGTCADLIALNNFDAAIDMSAVIAIGNNTIRYQKALLLEQSGFKLTTLVHPTAVVSQYATVVDGSVIFAGAIINAFAKVGHSCIINTGAIIEHDCVIGDFSHICPNVALAGGVIIGSNCWIGIGSQIKQLVSIGENTLIGAGSTVIKNVPDNVTAFGSPAVVMKNH